MGQTNATETKGPISGLTGSKKSLSGLPLHVDLHFPLQTGSNLSEIARLTPKWMHASTTISVSLSAFQRCAQRPCYPDNPIDMPCDAPFVHTGGGGEQGQTAHTCAGDLLSCFKLRQAGPGTGREPQPPAKCSRALILARSHGCSAG